MLYSITVEDPANAPFKYVSELAAFEKGKTYEFKPGVNVIAGPNGSGKSTLLNIIAAFAFCERSSESKVPSDVLRWPKLFNDADAEPFVRDGVKVRMDWCGKVFKYMTSNDLPYGAEQESLNNFGQYMLGSHSSTGEKTMQGVNMLFKHMFGMSDCNFPAKALKSLMADANGYWKPRIEALMKYYQSTQVIPSADDFEYTVLMDEPDRNLDVENSKEILGILSTRKEQTQIVAVVHNPALLYRLSKIDHVNFIEMEAGYIDNVKKFIEG